MKTFIKLSSGLLFMSASLLILAFCVKLAAIIDEHALGLFASVIGMAIGLFASSGTPGLWRPTWNRNAKPALPAAACLAGLHCPPGR